MLLEKRQVGETNRDYAVRMLRENIIRLELKPGSLISEQDIADELGMSRTPIREAIMELARTKIMEPLPQKGTRVSYLDYDLIGEARFLRMTLELALMDEICQKATEQHYIELEANVAMQKFYMEHIDQYRLLQLDDEFHRMFFQICNKMQCYTLSKQLGIHFDRVRYAILEDPHDNKTVQDHEDIVRLLRQGNVSSAKEVLRVHLSRFQADREKILKAHADYFK